MNIREIFRRIPTLVLVTQRDSAEAISQRHDKDRLFSARQHNAAEADQLLLGHRLANDRKRLLSDGVARHNEIGRGVVGRVDLLQPHKPVKSDGPGLHDWTRRLWRDDLRHLLQVSFHESKRRAWL